MGSAAQTKTTLRNSGDAPPANGLGEFQEVPEAASGHEPSPGIALAVLGITEGLASIGSLLTILSMLLFTTVIFTNRAKPA